MEEIKEVEKTGKQKYSLVTGEKIKHKSVRKLKKEHKEYAKLEQKNQKQLEKKKKKINKKLDKNKIEVESVTVSTSGIDEGNNSHVNIEGTHGIKQKSQEKEQILLVRRTEKNRPKTPKQKMRNFMSYVIVGLIAVFFGYFGGTFYIANTNRVDYSAFTESALRDDALAVYTRVSTSSASLTTQKAIDLFVASEYVLNNKNSFYSDVKGEIQPSIGSLQLIWGYKSKNGDIYDCENVSKGMLPVAEKYSYDSISKTAQVYKANKVTSTEALYPDSPTWIMSLEEYKTEYGTAPDSPCVPYIVSSKTVIEGSESVKKLSNGSYQVSFMLTTDSSVLNYVKQMKHMSGLKDYPSFKSIQVTAIINENLEFSYIRYDESYSVMYFGVMASCVGFVENTITY